MRQVCLVLAFLLAACGTAAPATTDLASPIAQPTGSAPTVADATGSEVTTSANARSITVGGMGAEYVEPTRCVIDIGVSSRRSSVLAASEAATASAEAMTEALLAGGLTANDIQTSEFSIYPYYDEYPAIAGYETHVGYRVRMPDTNDVGSVLARAIQAGGDDVRAWGVRFEADPTGLLEGARTAAWADARGRAESLAALAGVALGEVMDVHEKVLVSSSQGMMEGGEGDSASFDIPVSPGVTGVVVLLTATFAIDD